MGCSEIVKKVCGLDLDRFRIKKVGLSAHFPQRRRRDLNP